MATYFDDCSALTNWSEVGWNANAQFSISSGAISIGSTTGDALRFNPATSDADRDEIEIVWKQNSASLSTTYRRSAYIMGQDSSASMNGYVLEFSEDQLRIARWDGGVATALSATGTLTTIAQGVDVWFRFRRDASGVFYAKSWLDSGSEADAGGWQLTTSADTTYTTLGNVGFITSGASGTRLVKAFGVGTNGDTAPTSGTPASTGVRGRGLLMGIG